MNDVLSRLPEISCPFPSRQHPAVDLAETHVRYYGRRFGLVTSAASAERYDRAGFGTFAARTCPAAGDIELLAEWAAWLFVFDDEFDEAGDPYERARLVDPVLTEVRAILTGSMPVSDPGPTNVLTAALADMWPRTARLMSDGWRARFTRHLCAYVAVYKSEISNRRFGPAPSLQEYLPFRRIVSAVDVCWDMIEAAMGASLPEHLVESGPCRKVWQAANDITCWTNDIISLNKEYARGDLNNLVAVLQHADDSTWSAAAAKAADMVAERTGDFSHACRELEASRRLLPCTDTEWELLLRSIEAMRYWMAGSRHWHLWSRRYQDVEYAGPQQNPSYYDTLLGPGQRVSKPREKNIRPGTPVIRQIAHSSTNAEASVGPVMSGADANHQADRE